MTGASSCEVLILNGPIGGNLSVTGETTGDLVIFDVEPPLILNGRVARQVKLCGEAKLRSPDCGHY